MEHCLNLISELDARKEQIDKLSDQSRGQLTQLRGLVHGMSFVDLDRLLRQCHNSSVHQELLSEQRQRLDFDPRN